MRHTIPVIIITALVTYIGVELTARYGIIGFAPTAVIGAILVYLKYRIEQHLEEREERRMYASRVWGFVEHTRWDGDAGELERAKYHRDMLAEVENDLDVPVLVVMFKENRPNEKWEDFLIRLGEEVAEFKEKRDRELQKAVLSGRVSRFHGDLTRDWYYRVALRKRVPERVATGHALEMEINV